MDALRLLRLVHLRRELKLLCLVAIAALPVWGAFTLIAENVLSRSSQTFWSLDAKIGPGFAVILLVLLGAFLLLVASRLAGRTGAAAARLSPIFGGGPEPTLVDASPDAATALAPLIGKLRRKPLVRGGAVVLFATVGLMIGLVVWNIGPAWQANHGHGGTVVTVGKDASVDGYSIGSHGHRDYYLSTPDGRVLAEDSQPKTGQRWTVIHNATGDDEAYKVGGHDYLLLALIILVLGFLEVGVVGFAVSSARTERRLRAGTPGEIADSVRYLGSRDYLGNAPAVPLRIGAHQTVALTLRPLGERTAEALLARRRWVAAGTAAVVVAGGGTLIGLWQTGTFRTPSTERDASLSYLGGTGWDPSVYVDYTDTQATVDLVTSGLSQVGVPSAAVSETGQVLLDSADVPRGADIPVNADVDVLSIGSTSPAAAMSAVLRVERGAAENEHGSVTSLTGLPAGWQGIYTGKQTYEDPGLEIVGSAGGTLVWIEMNDTEPTAKLEQRGIALAHAIATHGIVPFAQDIAR